MTIQLYKGRTEFGKEIIGTLAIYNGAAYICETNQHTCITTRSSYGTGVDVTIYRAKDIKKHKTIYITD